MASPLVSVVTPCFRSARYLSRCIDSVLGQTHAHVEHVIQDASSDDGTRDILAGYAGRVDWVSEPDRGQADGLDRALKRCRGDIILVLNADDMLLPHAAAWAVEQLARFQDAGVVYGDIAFVNEDDEVVGTYRGPSYDYEQLVCVELVPPAQAAFVRRAALEAVGLGTDPELRTCPDYEMWVRLGRRFPMRYVPGVVAHYRQHAQSGSLRLDLVEQLVRDKRKIMDRLFDDPKTSAELKGLRRRAYAGLSLWAEYTRIEIAPRTLPVALLRAAVSAARHPSPRNFLRLARMPAAAAYFALRRRRFRKGDEAAGPWC